jgi:hypothetical protein
MTSITSQQNVFSMCLHLRLRPHLHDTVFNKSDVTVALSLIVFDRLHIIIIFLTAHWVGVVAKNVITRWLVWLSLERQT